MLEPRLEEAASTVAFVFAFTLATIVEVALLISFCVFTSTAAAIDVVEAETYPIVKLLLIESASDPDPHDIAVGYIPTVESVVVV